MLKRLLYIAYITLCYILTVVGPTQAHHAPVYVLDSDQITCTIANVKQEASGRVLAVTAAHCLKPSRQFDPVQGVWQTLEDYAPFTIHAPVSNEIIGTGAVVFVQGDLGLIAYTPQTPVTILPYKALEASKLQFGHTIVACGLIIASESSPGHQGLCLGGFWLNDIIRYEGMNFWAIQLPVRAGMSGGPIFHQGKVIGIYSIQIVTGSVSGMTPLNAAIPYLEGMR